MKTLAPWPNGWAATAVMALAHLPALIVAVMLAVPVASGPGPEPLAGLAILGIALLPAGVAVWAAWVVTRAGVRWLSSCAMALLGGVPMLAGGAALALAASGRGGDQLFRGVVTVLACAAASLVTAVSLSLFSAFAVVAAALLETTASRRA